MTWTLLSLESYGEHRAAWQALNRRGPGSQLLEPLFWDPLIDHFSTGEEVLGIYGDPATPQAMAILRRTGRFSWQTFQPAQAPIGAWLSEDGAVLEELLTSLCRALPGLAGVLGVSQQDPDLLARPADGGRLRSADYIDTARVTLAGDFASYWAARGKNLRQNMSKQRNRLGRENIATRLEILTAPEDMTRAVADYGALESAGWKGAAGTAVAMDNPQGPFYADLMRAFAVQGRAQVCRYFYNDRLTATDLCIDNGAEFIILKTTYDETEKKTSPAHLMRQELFEQLFDHSPIRIIEYYGRIRDWHTKWSDEFRTMFHVNYYRASLLARLHDLRRQTAK